METNPYESPSAADQSPPKKPWKRHIAIYVLVAILGFCAAFIFTAPAVAINGLKTEPYYWVGGAALAVVIYRVCC